MAGSSENSVKHVSALHRKERAMGANEKKEDVEVTPEMIRAGLEELKSAGLADDPGAADRVSVARIFQAMYRAYLDQRQHMDSRPQGQQN